MSAIQVPTAYKHLVKLVAYTFYSGECPPREVLQAADGSTPSIASSSQPSSKEAQPAAPAARSTKNQPSTAGLGIILLNALTERQWVKEDDLAQDLQLHAKMVRRAMRFLEEEQLVRREHRKETLNAKRKEAAALEKAGITKGQAAATGGAAAEEEEDEEPHKVAVISYCALDYPRLVDMLTYRLAVMASKAKKVAKGGDVIQQYRCTRPDCLKEYNSMQVFELIPVPTPGAATSEVELRCMVCGEPVELLEGGTEEQRKQRVVSMKRTAAKLEAALAPINEALNAVKALKAPDFDTYAQWVTQNVVLQHHINTGPGQGSGTSSSTRPAYGRGTSGLDAFNDNMQLVVDLGNGTTAGGSSSSMAGRLGGGPAGSSSAAGGGGGAAAAAAARAARPPVSPAGAGGAAAIAAAGKAAPPWLMKAGAQGVQGVASAAGSSSQAAGAPLTEAQRRAAFVQQLSSKHAGGSSSGAAAAGSGKPVPPWLMSSVASGKAGGLGVLGPRPPALMGLAPGLAAGLGGLVGLAAVAGKGQGKQDLLQQAAADGPRIALYQEDVDEEDREPDRKRFKPDPEADSSRQPAAAAAASSAPQPRELAPAAPAAAPVEDTVWEDVHEDLIGHPAAAPATEAEVGGSDHAAAATSPGVKDDGPASHALEPDVGEDVEWEDV